MSAAPEEAPKASDVALPATTAATSDAASASDDAHSEPTLDITVDEGEPEATAPTVPESLAGTYRVTHGTFTVGPQQWVGLGGLVELTDAEAKAALANKTVERA